MRFSRTILLLFFTAAAGCVSGPPPRKTPAPAPTLELQIVPQQLLAAPLFSLGAEPFQLLFHVNLVNAGPRPVTVKRLELRLERDGQLFERQLLEKPLLARQLHPAPWLLIRDRLSLAAAHRQRGRLERACGTTRIEAGGTVSWAGQLQIARAEEVPSLLVVEAQLDQGVARTSSQVQRYQQKTRLRLPIEGPGWWVLAGHHADEYHGNAVLLSQSFAYDLGRLGPGGATFNGDRRQNASYYAYGQPVMAAADGTVVDLHDGMPDNTPVGRRPSWQDVLRRPADLAGNYVVLEHQDGEYSAYLHLQPGLAVSRGQKLRAGQLLGRCGNSGNSLESHLHFQLQDGPEIMKAHGLPARFSDFTVVDGGRAYYVPADRALPLPSRLGIIFGRGPGAFIAPPTLAPGGP